MRGLGTWVGIAMLVSCGRGEPAPASDRTADPPRAGAAPDEGQRPQPSDGTRAPAGDGTGTPPSSGTGEVEHATSTGGAAAATSTAAGPATDDDGTAGPDPTDDDPAPAPAQPGADGKTFTVEARLVDRGMRTSHCGVLHLVGVMKLEVVAVLDGRYDGDTLYVYVSCPEMWLVGKPHRFEVGTVYRWTLDTRIERRTAGAKLDAFREVKAPRYRLKKIEPLP